MKFLTGFSVVIVTRSTWFRISECILRPNLPTRLLPSGDVLPLGTIVICPDEDGVACSGAVVKIGNCVSADTVVEVIIVVAVVGVAGGGVTGGGVVGVAGGGNVVGAAVGGVIGVAGGNVVVVCIVVDGTPEVVLGANVGVEPVTDEGDVACVVVVVVVVVVP